MIAMHAFLICAFVGLFLTLHAMAAEIFDFVIGKSWLGGWYLDYVQPWVWRIAVTAILTACWIAAYKLLVAIVGH